MNYFLSGLAEKLTDIKQAVQRAFVYDEELKASFDLEDYSWLEGCTLVGTKDLEEIVAERDELLAKVTNATDIAEETYRQLEASRREVDDCHRGFQASIDVDRKAIEAIKKERDDLISELYKRSDAHDKAINDGHRMYRELVVQYDALDVKYQDLLKNSEDYLTVATRLAELRVMYRNLKDKYTDLFESSRLYHYPEFMATFLLGDELYDLLLYGVFSYGSPTLEADINQELSLILGTDLPQTLDEEMIAEECHCPEGWVWSDYFDECVEDEKGRKEELESGCQ